MTELIPREAVHFAQGGPLCPFQECYRCFEGRDIAYRLVDPDTKRWLFYNDSTDTLVHVRAIFAAGCVLKPLQRAHMRLLPDPASGAVGKACPMEVTLDVEPGYTEFFIEGAPTEFHFEFRTETAPARNVEFVYRKPSLPYDKIYRCFKENGNGLLFRLVDERTHRWAFYNDTTEFMMRVSVTFANRAEVRPLGSTTAANTSAAPGSETSDSVVYTLAVAPGQTEPFTEGSPVTYTLEFAAEPVPAPTTPTPPPEEPVQYQHGAPDATVIPHQTHVYKCFKEHGNGLLFRVVDDVNAIWAFYNDTPEYVMTANMRYPSTSAVRLAPCVQVIADGEREGGVIAAVEVPPLATVPFLVGAPATYELAFSATPVGALAPSPAPSSSELTGPLQYSSASAPSTTPPPVLPVPEEAPAYANGHPDPALVPRVDEVYKCFKEHGNGLMFRLVDKAQRRWAFYNDTTDVLVSVRVQFPAGARIEPLGHTVLAHDRDTGDILCELLVRPRETAVFVQGDVDSFTTKFVAEHVQA